MNLRPEILRGLFPRSSGSKGIVSHFEFFGRMVAPNSFAPALFNRSLSTEPTRPTVIVADSIYSKSLMS
ncbi:hypothetical protein MAL04_08765 [Leptospira noguchii]|nr:hypothetical protein MAL04_08765 [Leptospira noguchii]